jgi:hypothetical protein
MAKEVFRDEEKEPKELLIGLLMYSRHYTSVAYVKWYGIFTLRLYQGRHWER